MKSDRSTNIVIVIVLIVFGLATFGISHILDLLGLSEELTQTVGYLALVGLLALYVICRQKESKNYIEEITNLKEEVARLEVKSNNADYYKERYEYYYDKFKEIKRMGASNDGKET